MLRILLRGGEKAQLLEVKYIFQAFGGAPPSSGKRENLKVNSQRSRQAKPWDLMVSRLYCTNEELIILLDLWLTYSVSQSKSAAFGVDGNFLTFARSIKDTRRMSTTCYLFRFCICLSRSPPREWRRPRGRPHLTWATQISAIRPIADIASLAQDRAAFKRWTATVT